MSARRTEARHGLAPRVDVLREIESGLQDTASTLDVDHPSIDPHPCDQLRRARGPQDQLDDQIGHRLLIPEILAAALALPEVSRPMRPRPVLDDVAPARAQPR